MNMRRPVPALSNRVRTGLDGLEPIAAVGVGERDPVAGEIPIQRCRIGIGRLGVAPGGVRLPDLDLGALDRPALDVEQLYCQVEQLRLRTGRPALDHAE